MATLKEYTLTLAYGNCQDYFTSSNGSVLMLDHNFGGTSTYGLSLMHGTSETATMKDTAKAILYPTSTAHPFKMDVYVTGTGRYRNKNVKLSIDGTTVVDQSFTIDHASNEETHLLSDLTSSAITNSTRNSAIVITLSATTRILAAYALGNSSYIKTYFYLCNFTGTNNCENITSITTPGQLYTGETGNYTAQIKDGAVWQGWYSDAEHTQLVSTNQTYSVTASDSDLTLYPYAIIPVSNKKIYLKENNVWNEYSKVYIKENGSWVEKSMDQISTILDTTANYVKGS